MNSTKIFKIILIGDGGVGKTSLRKQYFGEVFETNYLMTLGADFALKRTTNRVLQIWDLAGQPVFHQFRKNYYHGAHGALLLFDLMNEESLKNLDTWLDEVQRSLGKQIVTVILGNKVDLIDEDNPVISVDMIQNQLYTLSEKYGLRLSYMPTSALTGMNVDIAFEVLIDEITGM